jgi:hypothetical protein
MWSREDAGRNYCYVYSEEVNNGVVHKLSGGGIVENVVLFVE